MTYTIELTQQEIQVIYMGLGELPLKIGVNLLGKIQSSVQQQDAAQAKPLDGMLSGGVVNACKELADNDYVDA